MIERPIIVLGTPRSGTSLTAGLLHHCGVWAGECRQADQWNPRGYFENIALTQLRKNRALSLESVKRALENEGYQGGPWLYKSTPWSWRFWEPFNPFWVLVRRPSEAVLVSRKRGPWFDETEAEARSVVQRDLDLMNQIVKCYPDTVINVDGHVLVSDRNARVALADACGLDYTAAADSFVDGSLWHGVNYGGAVVYRDHEASKVASGSVE